MDGKRERKGRRGVLADKGRRRMEERGKDWKRKVTE